MQVRLAAYGIVEGEIDPYAKRLEMIEKMLAKHEELLGQKPSEELAEKID
jgi:hypothetical protein